jgi:multiple sugar transport system permease protein
LFRVYGLAFVDFAFGRSAAVAMVLLALSLALTALGLRMQKRWVHYDQ